MNDPTLFFAEVDHNSASLQTLPTNDQDLFKLSCHKMDAFRALLEQEPWPAE